MGVRFTQISKEFTGNTGKWIEEWLIRQSRLTFFSFSVLVLFAFSVMVSSSQKWIIKTVEKKDLGKITQSFHTTLHWRKMGVVNPDAIICKIYHFLFNFFPSEDKTHPCERKGSNGKSQMVSKFGEWVCCQYSYHTERSSVVLLLYRPTAMKNLYVLHRKKQHFDIAVTLKLE